ncbi:MerR family transcriptional regulator [Levilactobacillus yiduensis]|uniref:MerR family transcriptional regulator n=1 Tax=Levilactobacillus yiduensis TaxID=2953880 RepID=UPI000EF2E4CE|nr:MerR family transcriptional regulator [Levilactobacillus yiduensis]AYM03922.1 MerR family transcriptional regulator [Levilactobacillus brevis]
MNIKEFATRVNCSPDTLRFYEKMGMIVPKRTTTGNYRQYTVTDLTTYRIIHSLKRAGLSLEEIYKVLKLRDAKVSAIHCADTLRFITGKHAQFADDQGFYAKLTKLTAKMTQALSKSTLSHNELATMIEQIGELDDQVV